MSSALDVVTVSEAVRDAADRLARAGVPAPEVDAELLVAHTRVCTRTRLRLDASAGLTRAQHDDLEAMVRRRAARVPLQLILGSVGFRYLDLEVRPGVFIPRPETEVLAGEAIVRVPDGGVVVEPCTGSGAVACAVAHESSAGTVVATDTDGAAVALARRNAAPYAVVRIRQGDLLAPVDPRLRGSVDVLVANPPYLASREWAGLAPEIVRHDPRSALVSGATGHEVADALIAEAVTWLRTGGWLLLEVDVTRAEETSARCCRAGLRDAQVVADLTGADRIVVARR